MSAVKPQPGMVIKYAHAWGEADKDSNNKARPAMIIVALENGRVLVLPITHSLPQDDQDAIEIPQNLKQSLGLDAARQWIRMYIPNTFTWMGFDVTPADSYPIAPRWFYEQVAKKYLEVVEAGRVNKINRD